MKNDISRADVFQWIMDQGAVRAIVRYSGGGDEGGVSSIELLDDTDNTVREFNEEREVEWNPEMERWQLKDPTPEKYINQALCAPVYEKYGSFSDEGNWYVDGTITWDATEKTVRDENEQSHQEWEEEVL